MKSPALCLLILLSITFLPAQNSKPSIGVLDLDPTGISRTDAQFLTDRLRTELFETGAFQVVERDKMNAILAEQGFQQTGCTNVECAVEIGQLLNVRQIIAGSIGKIEDIYSISLRVINVQTGVIVKTATRDHKGKLSEVLTQVIPEIAVLLAKKDEKAAARPEPIKEKKIIHQTPDERKYSVALKGGQAFLRYTQDANKAINDVKNNLYFHPNFNKYANHYTIGLEAGYLLAHRWQLTGGLGFEKILKTWRADGYYGYDYLYFANQYTFVNPYLGINYNLVHKPERYKWDVGVDAGTMILKTNIIYTEYSWSEKVEKNYSYTTYCFKLSTGFGYFISHSFMVGFELALQLTGACDLSKQRLTQSPDSGYINNTFKDVLLWKKITATGIQTNLFLSYNF